MAVPYRSSFKFLVLIFTIQFLVFINNVNGESSGDGPLIDDEEEIFAGSSRTFSNQPEDPDWKFDEDDDLSPDVSSSSSSSSSSSTTTEGSNSEIVVNIDGSSGHHEANNETDVTNTTMNYDEDVDSATGTIILVTLAVVALFLILCAWRIVQVRRQRSRRRNLRNHALNASLNGEKKPEARELLTMTGAKRIQEDDVEASDKGREAMLPATFSTTVTVEQMDSLTRRLQPPPPSYEESMRSSSMDRIENDGGDTTIESLGPSYR